MVEIEEREEQREAAQCGELEMAEEREWEGKAVQDGELAGMEERERERRLEKSQGGEGNTGAEAGMEGREQKEMGRGVGFKRVS